MKRWYFAAGMVATTAAVLFAGLYAIKARDSAIRGWAEVAVLQEKLGTPNDQYRRMILRDAGIHPFHPLERRQVALAVRDYIYRTNWVSAEPSPPITDPAEKYLMMGYPRGENSCGGLSVIYAWSLHQVGIPARTVQLAGKDYIAGRDVLQNHVTVEVYIDNKWEISDPLFNASFDCSNGAKNLSIPEAFVCLQSGSELVPLRGKTREGKGAVTFENAGVSYPDYYGAYVRQPYREQDFSAEIDEYPEAGWLDKAMKLYPDFYGQ